MRIFGFNSKLENWFVKKSKFKLSETFRFKIKKIWNFFGLRKMVEIIFEILEILDLKENNPQIYL